MLNDNSFIIYKKATGGIVGKITINPAFIIKNTDEEILPCTVTDLKSHKVDISDPSNPIIVAADTFTEGALSGDYYTISNLPTDGLVSVIWEDVEYKPTDGFISLLVDVDGEYSVRVSHPTYETATFTFTKQA